MGKRARTRQMMSKGCNGFYSIYHAVTLDVALGCIIDTDERRSRVIDARPSQRCSGYGLLILHVRNTMGHEPLRPSQLKPNSCNATQIFTVFIHSYFWCPCCIVHPPFGFQVRYCVMFAIELTCLYKLLDGLDSEGSYEYISF